MRNSIYGLILLMAFMSFTDFTHGQETVDLGLSVKWSSCNLGASSPEDFGKYYAWGYTQGYEPEEHDFSKTYWKYSWSCWAGNYQHDAATAALGEHWSIPTAEQMSELIEKCSKMEEYYNGVHGYRFTGPNGNSIFLPSASIIEESSIKNPGNHIGKYCTDLCGNDNIYYMMWNADSSYDIFRIPSIHYYDYHNIGGDGTPIRPVYYDEPVIHTVVESDWVDLGLPSGKLWATCNLGSTTPEGYGNYYAVADSIPRSIYGEGTYRWKNLDTDGMRGWVIDENEYTLMPEFDAATVALGPNWRIPTIEEFTELIDYCTCSPSELEGVSGFTFIGPNGNSLFLPYAGLKGYNGYESGTKGAYISSSYRKYYNFYVNLKGECYNKCGDVSHPECGYSVRPIYVGIDTGTPPVINNINGDTKIYRIDGIAVREMSNPGFYIVNGKKVIVK